MRRMGTYRLAALSKRVDPGGLVELVGWGVVSLALGMIYVPLGVLMVGVTLILIGGLRR